MEWPLNGGSGVVEPLPLRRGLREAQMSPILIILINTFVLVGVWRD